jgi:excisionase family DNA binding protein
LHNLHAGDHRAAKSGNDIVASRRTIGVCLMIMSEERRAVSIVEAARICGLSRATVYRLIAQKKLATVKIGSRRIVPLTSIDALLNAAK